MAIQRTVAESSAVNTISTAELGMPYSPYCKAIIKKPSKSLPLGSSQ